MKYRELCCDGIFFNATSNFGKIRKINIYSQIAFVTSLSEFLEILSFGPGFMPNKILIFRLSQILQIKDLRGHLKISKK